MLDWLPLSDPQRLVVAAAFLFAIAAALLALVPTREQGILARRIAALHPATAKFRRRLLEPAEVLAAATTPLARCVLGSVEREQLQRMLGEAVVFRRFGFLLFAGIVVLMAAGWAALAWTVSARLAGGMAIVHWLYVGTGALIGAYMPNLALRKMAGHRLREIELGLPDALDLLVICAEAGLSFEIALDRVARELRLSRRALASEFTITSADLRLWPDRDAALAALATRVPIKGMQTVVTTLAHSMRYGTPLVQSLRVMATTLRNDALLALEERAGHMPALMTIPMILFTLPATFLVLVGPAALHIWDRFHT